MRLTHDLRSLIGKAIDRGIKKTLLAKVLGVTRKTIYKWCKRKLFKDRKRRPKRSKITLEIELFILTLRNTFKWGTAKIQQGLYSLPKFMLDTISSINVRVVQSVQLSRTAINNVLKKHKINGYLSKIKKWKFFRAKAPNVLWQLDLKGPFTLSGKKHWFVVCIDDFSRYLLLAEHINHCPSTKEITDLLDKLPNKPKKLLTDNAKHFAKQWKNWCKANKIEPLFAHPYYPQDKGKVERAIRTISEEFIYLLRKFPNWLSKLKEYIEWHNEKRFHRGVYTVPKELYT